MNDDFAGLTARVERLERLIFAMIGGDEAELEQVLDRLDGLLDEVAPASLADGDRDA